MKKPKPKARPKTRGPRPKAGKAGVFPIVGVGASAGGLDALERLLKGIPADSGMAFLIVQHLDPTHESKLSAILARSTSIPVAEAEDRMAVAPNHVYVIPANANMFVDDSLLRLAPRGDPSALHLPVDSLFRSLANAHQNRAIGVILSGTASDGAAGMRAIKGEGGITFAQDAASAKYFGMPHASISAGVVDFVLPPEEIAASLARIGRHPNFQLPPDEEVKPLPAGHTDALGQLFQLLKRHFDVDFSEYKPSTILRRIKRRMALKSVEGIADYVQRLRNDPDELRALYQEMFIGVTDFFREPETFEALKKLVFPRLMKERGRDRPIRIWVPGCSTGEEVYSIAIALLEYLKDRPASIPIQVFGTDVNDEAIKNARHGRYLSEVFATVSRQRLKRYFTKTEHGYQVNKLVRDLCVFAKHNILGDPPFSRLDLLSCRNVLIYLDVQAQRKLLPLFHFTLRPAGFLLLGSSESTGGFGELFTLVDRRNRIYAKRASLTRPRFDWVPEHGSMPALAEPVGVAAPPHRSDFDVQKEAADLILLNEYAPAAVLVNDQMEILHFRGHTGPYLEPSPGVASLNLMKMAREGLIGGLRTALGAARKKNAAAQVAGVRIEQNGDERIVDLAVVPVKASGTNARSFLVMFNDVKAPTGRDAKPKRDAERRERDARLERQKQELTATKSYLQSVIESQDAANEELRSLNEELQSANEELQSTSEELETSNEELQSANEELITLNEELQHRNAELGVAHTDINNLLNSLRLSLIMVDRDLRIRRMTPLAQNEMGVQPPDVGRPLVDIRTNVEIPDLEKRLTHVIQSGESRRDELAGRDGRWRTVDMSACVNLEGEVSGAILVVADVSAEKRAEQMFRVLVESAPDAMVIADAQGTIKLVNAQLEQLSGHDRQDLVGRSVEVLVPEPLREQHRGHRHAYLAEPRMRPMGTGLALFLLRKDGSQVPVEVSLSPIETPEGLLVATTLRDVSQRRALEQEARRLAVLGERRLAREIHDNLAQALSGIVVQLEAAEDTTRPAEVRLHLGKARDLARASLDQARRSLLAMRPEVLDLTDLAGGLERTAADLTTRTGLEVNIMIRGPRRRLPGDVEENLLRIGQEALLNVVRHAAAQRALVRLVYANDKVDLTVQDDGRGFDTQASPSGFGLPIMKDRAASINGEIAFHSEPGKGTRVEVRVPLAEDAKADA